MTSSPSLSEDEFESPLRFPNPSDEKYFQNYTLIWLKDAFVEDYESCLIELGIIIEKVYDPRLRKKLESLMRGVEDWLK